LVNAYPLDRCPIIVPALQKHRAKIAKLFSLSHAKHVLRNSPTAHVRQLGLFFQSRMK
jgi:hypothetical protein